MTPQERKSIVSRYNKAPHDGIHDVYTKPSHNKINAYEKIYHEMLECSGFGLKILTYNTFMFTCAYLFVDTDGVINLVYHTPTKREIFPM